MALSEAQGHGVGYALAATAVGAVGRMVYMETINPFWSFVTVTCAAASTYLFQRLYLDDPKAVEKYRGQFESQLLSKSLGSYSVPDAVAIMGHGRIRELMERETRGFESLSVLARTYGIGKLSALNKADVVTKTELSTAASADVASAKTFTALWDSYPDFPEAFAVGVFSRDSLVSVMQAEYGWVHIKRGDLQPCAPSDVPPGYPRASIFQAVAQYAKWSMGELHVAPLFWQTVLRTCPEAKRQDTDFSVVMNNGLLALHELGLIDIAWAQDLFLRESQRKRWTLWTAEDTVGLKNLMTAKLLLPATIQDLFAEAIPLNRCVANRVSRETSIVDFALYWESALRLYPQLIPAKFRHAISDAQRKYRDAERRAQSAMANAQAQYDAAVTAIAAATAKQPPGAKKDATAAAKRAAQNAKEAGLEKADAEFRAACIEIHNEFTTDAAVTHVMSEAINCAMQ